MISFTKETKVKEEINRLNKITKYISMIRLIIALCMIVSIICLISLKDYILYGILSISFIVVFISFILFTNKFYTLLNLERKKEKIYMLHYKRRNLDFSCFLDEGRDYIIKDDYKLLDLDLFGSKSLFQYLNVCRTKPGRDMLAGQLIKPKKMTKGFTESINSMASSEDTLDIEAGLLEFDESAKHTNYDEFNSLLNNKISFKWFFIIPLLLYISAIAYLILFLTIKINPYPILIIILANMLLTNKLMKNDVFSLDSFKYYSLCDSYYSLAKRILAVDIRSKYLDDIKSKLENNLINLKRIKRIYLALSTRKNIVARILMNSLFVYDFWLVIIYNNLIKNIKSLDELFSLVAEVEVMVSFSNIGIDNETYSIPSNSKAISTYDMYHPLVLGCVKNSFCLNGGVVLTGSNMSGKTTFMRTLGINQILFNAGSIVCASEYKSDSFNVYTSLRANDMLSEGISTFYAEILRIKKVNEAIKNDKCLILIDEIFKGTNATERIEASLRVMEKLNKYKALFIVSTHDFELCDAENILNYHFNEEYHDDKIFFDYLIKDGKSNSTNAMYLLKMADII